MMDLNEHIKRMKDLFFAEHGIVKPLISEQDEKSLSGQVTQSGTFKDINPDALFDIAYEGDFSVKSSEKKRIESQNPNFSSQLSELKKNPAYKPLIDKIKDDTDEMKIFYFYLTQVSRLQFLNQTLEFLRSFTKRRQLAKQLKKDENYTGEDNLYGWDAELTKGDIVKSEIPAAPVEGEDAIEFEIPLEVAGKTVYKENSTEPDLTLIQAIDNWVADAKTQIDSVKSINPDAVVELVSIDIASSCSRLRNTGAYDGVTWSVLSKDRVEKVYEVLIGKLSSIGVTLDPKLQKVLRGGYNGDGSSGPDPSKKFTFYDGKTTNNMAYSTTGADRLTGPDEQRKAFEYGGLLSTQKDSDQYKFCLVVAKIKITAKEQGPPEMKPTITKSQGYSLLLTPLYKEKEKEIKLKGGKQFKFKGGDTGGGSTKTLKVKGKLIQCAAYGNKIGT